LVFNGENGVSKCQTIDYIHPDNPLNEDLKSAIFEEFCCEPQMLCYGEDEDDYALWYPNFVVYGLKPLAYIVQQYFNGGKIRAKKISDDIMYFDRYYATGTCIQLV
jgi:hypothetical protein